MGLNAILTGAATGLVGKLFGGGGKRKLSFAEKIYRNAINEALKTNLEELDRRQIEAERRTSREGALDALSAYDAIAAGLGSDIGQFDSRKEIAKSLIAYRAARDLAGREAELASSRPFRRLFLATGGGAAGDLGRLSLAANAAYDQRRSDDFGSLLELITELFRKKSGGGGGGLSPRSQAGMSGASIGGP